MKKLLSILLATVLLLTLFVGCSKEDPPDDTTETTSTLVDDIPVEMGKDVDIENVTTDEDGNEVLVGKDTDGNTVEIKKDKDGTVTKTVTDKDTGEKTEQTTTVVTTTKPNTTKPAGTTKPSGNTKPDTTKPSTTKPNTTTHTHDYQPVYKTEPVYETQRVKVKDAYDEPVTKRVQAYYCKGCGIECVQESHKYGCNYQEFHMQHCHQGSWQYEKTNVPVCDMHLCNPGDTLTGITLCSGSGLGKPNYINVTWEGYGTIHHDAVYEDRKVQTGTKQVISGYKCSTCGATK